MLEKDIEKHLTKKVKELKGRCLKWVCPGWAGVPDRMVLLPRGRIYFVELKREKGGRLSKLQEKWHEWLRELGFEVFVLWSKDEVNDFIAYVKEK